MIQQYVQIFSLQLHYQALHNTKLLYNVAYTKDSSA